MIYDCAVIGTGPAGLSAALNLKIHEKSFLWIGRRALSDKIARAEQIRNYPGFPDAGGDALAGAFRRHAEAMGLEITEAMVNSILPMGDHYALMAGADFYEARTLILTTGINQAGTLPGEAERVGRGVSYCATCDGGLYRGRTIAVVCIPHRRPPGPLLTRAPGWTLCSICPQEPAASRSLSSACWSMGTPAPWR